MSVCTWIFSGDFNIKESCIQTVSFASVQATEIVKFMHGKNSWTIHRLASINLSWIDWRFKSGDSQLGGAERGRVLSGDNDRTQTCRPAAKQTTLLVYTASFFLHSQNQQTTKTGERKCCAARRKEQRRIKMASAVADTEQRETKLTLCRCILSLICNSIWCIVSRGQRWPPAHVRDNNARPFVFLRFGLSAPANSVILNLPSRGEKAKSRQPAVSHFFALVVAFYSSIWVVGAGLTLSHRVKLKYYV